MSKIPLQLQINGETYELLAEPHWTLLHVLRAQLGLTGTKENCLEAECGVCTILLDGRAVNACILLAIQCRGRDIQTVEGLGRPGHLHPLQQAFIDHGAAQCGYCTPGMLLAAKSYLDEHPGVVPEPDAVREAVAGTLCRCTGYQKIVDAIRAAAQRMQETAHAEALRLQETPE
jgi:aerobic carbon-monoxide dehydrogenase small subunit